MSFNKKNIGILFAIVILYLPNIGHKALANSKDKHGLIRRICIINFKRAIKNSGNPSPKGMEDYTCKCLSKEIQDGKSLNASISICKEKAKKNFLL